MNVRHHSLCFVVSVMAVLALVGCDGKRPSDVAACAKLYLRSVPVIAQGGIPLIADKASSRFQGKVSEEDARCRGGETAVAFRSQPWMDWPNFWATGDTRTRGSGLDWFFGPNERGIHGALLDLERLRMELIKFNLADNSGTYEEYLGGRDGKAGRVLKEWPALRLAKDDPNYGKLKVESDGRQVCQGELIRFRNVTGICNDIRNPLMGSTDQPFARNVQFEETFPNLGMNEVARNRHGDRLGLLKPDPQVISRKLFTRAQTQPDKCLAGLGMPGHSPEGHCDYTKAPTLNVLAAFWIQFMTHDWFSHLREGHNEEVDGKPILMPVGCTPEDAGKIGCRPRDRVDQAYVADQSDPPTFSREDKTYLTRAYRTTQNTVTAWWDASQLYGFDQRSRRRVKRDPRDPALLLVKKVGGRTGAGEEFGYLPIFEPGDPIHHTWSGQEATAFADNWSVGLSFYHNLFAREHNLFVAEFRRRAAASPDADSGLRNPDIPHRPIRYQAVSPDELFEVARLVVSAEIAKIHSIEWTTQLLYDEALYEGMNANWHGLLRDTPLLGVALEKVLGRLSMSDDPTKANELYSAFAAGPGIFGLGSRVPRKGVIARFDPEKDDRWSLTNPDHVNGGVNHFGSPFNFPEEFVTVYRLHPLLPDLLEYRELDKDTNFIRAKIPLLETLRSKATATMHGRGLANWALSMGRQRLGALTLQNHPQFLQDLPMPRLETRTHRIDVAALDIIRDRERGVPRFNEFRRQYGLRTLRSFDDFVDRRLPTDSVARKEQERLVPLLREVYGQHRCDASKVITSVQAQVDDEGRIRLDDQGRPMLVNDCLGFPSGTLVDNIEDLDTVVGWLAEPKIYRPHGFAISETQFQVFILNASRRLYSDRFLTSSFRPEFYTHLGVEWVNNNGPLGKVMEKGRPNGHHDEVSPLKRVMLRAIPELAPELADVINVFDPWGRDRGEYYSLAWKPRLGAESDPSFE